MRLIDADPMLEQLELEHYDKDWYVSQYNADWISSWLESQPVIEAEPVKHGRWIDHCVRDWRCSECGEKIMQVRSIDGYCYDDKPNYCPNCGCKMDLEQAHED